ncbi:MAG: MutS-related protein [Bryobacteraceae bacterium]
MAPNGGPRDTYRARLEAVRRTQSGYERRHKRFGLAKLVAAAAAIALTVWSLYAPAISIAWVAMPVAAFVWLAIAHERVILAMRYGTRVINFYERALARLDNRWMGAGETGERYLNAAHPYARDLDLFGKGALFDLLCTARTRQGEECLAHWLLAPAVPEEVVARQAALEELRGRLDLREDLAVLGEDIRAGNPPELLAAWGEGVPLLPGRWIRAAAHSLSALWVMSLVAWAVGSGWYAVVAVTIVNVFVARHFTERLENTIGPVERVAQDLAVLAEILERLERETFSSPKLLVLQHAFGDLQREPPSRVIARLNRLVGWLESRRHRLVELIDPAVLWSLQFAFAIEAWRARSGPAVRGWLAAVGEFEALLALSNYAYEHPADVFPEFIAESPWFEAEAFAHPLLPEGQAVRNDLRLGGDFRLLIISGPNMAGKSTFVRSVGINAVLAQCGAPVRARRLRLSPMAVTASICILDSLQGGVSHFYAEIMRLKQIADLTSGPLPVLFLLDELLQGTNSHDRRVGAEMIVRSLVRRGAMGMVTTHDLALTRIADSMGARAANFHFEDRIEDGKLRFDFRLTPGVVQTSNALALMRSIGLEDDAGSPAPL